MILLNEKEASVKEITGRNTLETEETVRKFPKYLIIAKGAISDGSETAKIYFYYHGFHVLEINLTHSLHIRLQL